MAGFWPTPEAIRTDPIVAGKMNALPKVVFSRTLDKVEWNNTRLVKVNMEEEIGKMKQLPGKDMALLGSGTIMAGLARTGLIDEYRIMVNPLVLGAGTPLFKGISRRLDLKLLEAQAFHNGNVALRYEPVRKGA
jgi:dihydrofolate reductase